MYVAISCLFKDGQSALVSRVVFPCSFTFYIKYVLYVCLYCVNDESDYRDIHASENVYLITSNPTKAMFAYICQVSFFYENKVQYIHVPSKKV